MGCLPPRNLERATRGRRGRPPARCGVVLTPLFLHAALESQPRRSHVVQDAVKPAHKDAEEQAVKDAEKQVVKGAANEAEKDVF